MLKAEEQMELMVLKKHGEKHPGAYALDGPVAEHGAAVFARRRGCGPAQAGAEAG